MLSAALGLSACATSEERCVRDATRDLRTVDALIVETEDNLARGFAYEREVIYQQQLTFCAGASSYNYRRGGFYGGTTFCTAPFPTERTRPVAIDPVAERRKLDSLWDQRQRLEGTTQNRVAACG